MLAERNPDSVLFNVRELDGVDDQQAQDEAKEEKSGVVDVRSMLPDRETKPNLQSSSSLVTSTPAQAPVVQNDRHHRFLLSSLVVLFCLTGWLAWRILA